MHIKLRGEGRNEKMFGMVFAMVLTSFVGVAPFAAVRAEEAEAILPEGGDVGGDDGSEDLATDYISVDFNTSDGTPEMVGAVTIASGSEIAGMGAKGFAFTGDRSGYSFTPDNIGLTAAPPAACVETNRHLRDDTIHVWRTVLCARRR